MLEIQGLAYYRTPMYYALQWLCSPRLQGSYRHSMSRAANTRIPFMVRVVGSIQDLTDSPGKNKSSRGTKNSPVGGSAARADTCHSPGASPTEMLPLQFPRDP